jgi:hypothetical protein
MSTKLVLQFTARAGADLDELYGFYGSPAADRIVDGVQAVCELIVTIARDGQAASRAS